jgi:hypothetical protein
VQSFSNQLVSLALLVALATAGCSSGDRPDLAKASGVVKLNGIPVPMASVTFVPVNGGRPATATTDEDGTYVIRTYDDADGEGAAVGEHYVGIMKIASDEAKSAAEGASTADQLSGVTDDAAATSSTSIAYFIPQNYMNPQTSGLKITVPSEGSDKLDFDLKK